MIVLNVTYQSTAEQREAFLKKLNEEGLAAACRAEEGNLGYDFFLPVGSPDDLLLIEKYTDDPAVFSHAGQPHIKKLVALKDEYVADMAMERYEGDGKMPAF